MGRYYAEVFLSTKENKGTNWWKMRRGKGSLPSTCWQHSF